MKRGNMPTLNRVVIGLSVVIALFAAGALAAKPSAEALATGKALGEMRANTPPAKVYEIFNDFCKAPSKGCRQVALHRSS